MHDRLDGLFGFRAVHENLEELLQRRRGLGLGILGQEGVDAGVDGAPVSEFFAVRLTTNVNSGLSIGYTPGR